MNPLEQFKHTYITECYELLSDMEERLLSLRCNEGVDAEQLNAIFRCAHSIKGGSGAFGLDYITHFTHVLEALLDAMRDGRVLPTEEGIDLLLKATDIVTQMIHAAREDRVPPHGLGAEILLQLQALSQDAPSSTLPQHTSSPATSTSQSSQWHIQFTPHEQLFLSGNEPLLILRELSRMGDITITPDVSLIPTLEQLAAEHCYMSWAMMLGTTRSIKEIQEVFEFVEDHCTLTILPADTMPTPASANTTDKPKQIPAKTDVTEQRTGANTSIRVDIDKIDRLVNLVGELVITEAMLKAQLRTIPIDQGQSMIRGIEELSHHTRELQEAVMAMRMQPVKSVFSRMPRIVRDLSNQLGKNIRLEMSGEHTEVDKTVIEQLADPLTHMIRNSVDHGIESPEIRLQQGKPEQGTIHLSAEHRGGRIIIQIRDDGAGINRAKVLAKAKDKGLVAADATLNDEACDYLIFHAGFSTADTVSNVSGRGVGMDVVKRNIESLEGTVSIKNDPGKGAVFTVSLPLTLAILDGMIVRVGTEFYIVPTTSIIETLRLKRQEIRRVEGHQDVINVRGEFVSILYLQDLLSVAGSGEDPEYALVVLVECGQEKVGLSVDELVGQQQVVIKSLEANTDPVMGISGATILGDGRVSLILEINELKQLSTSKPSFLKPLTAYAA